MAGASAHGKSAGVIVFVAAAQFILSVTVAEDIYPGYSVANNYISDLGVGATAHLFNGSIIILGLLLIAAAVLIRRMSLPFSASLVLSGIGSIGVGVFPETTGIYHTISALFAFLFASIAPYFLIARLKNVISVFWGILGTLGLVSLILFDLGMDFGLGRGGMERMILYADIIWALSFSGWLFSYGSLDR
ncbi:MAG TPA: DUF998 domain-containing protein [Thermoplasmataceae archaeon]|nr:DUF998 domain-containing protein [Thermoplasmatales archaeon AK]HLH85582.1 DUF998 domain-containing protein [Thermoplasmataceae archaeon]